MRALISLTTRSAMMRSRSLRSSSASALAASPMGRSQISLMPCPPTVTARENGFNRAPPQALHGTSRMYPSAWARWVSVSASVWRRASHGSTPSKRAV